MLWPLTNSGEIALIVEADECVRAFIVAMIENARTDCRRAVVDAAFVAAIIADICPRTLVTGQAWTIGRTGDAGDR
jgi:hypothetical protein